NLTDKNSAARMWTLKKLEPELYGDKQTIDLNVDDRSKEHAKGLSDEKLKKVALALLEEE
ncbi:hypothetical protein DF186_16255, partial [Enterococcus hirae]